MNKYMEQVGIATMVASLALIPAMANAGNPCKSQWSKASGAFKKFESPASKIVCLGVGVVTTPAGSIACIKSYESGKATAQKMAKQYNANINDSGKIGPRGCAPDIRYKGTVLSERTFHCVPSSERHITVDFKLTGGKAKKPLTVDVCFIDGNGNSKFHRSYSYSGAKSNVGKGFKKTYKGKAGMIPMIYLHKQTGVNGYKYTLKTSFSGGEPKVVKDSRAVAN